MEGGREREGGGRVEREERKEGASERGGRKEEVRKEKEREGGRVRGKRGREGEME